MKYIKNIIQELRWNLWWRGPLHSFYRWYLAKHCGGSHHVGEYGADGRYIVLMNEHRYHRYMQLAHYDDPGERLLKQVRDEFYAKEEP